MAGEQSEKAQGTQQGRWNSGSRGWTGDSTRKSRDHGDSVYTEGVPGDINSDPAKRVCQLTAYPNFSRINTFYFQENLAFWN